MLETSNRKRFGDCVGCPVLSANFGEIHQIGVVTQEFLDGGGGIRRF